MYPIHLSRLAAELSATPAMGTAEYAKWVRQRDFLNFMAANAQDKDHVVLDASGRHLLIQSALVPEKALAKGNVDDLLSWSGFSPTWGITSTFRNRRPKAWLSPPDFDCKLLSQGEPLLFHRSFDGRDGDKTYVELSPRLSHPHDLHFVESRRAFCRFDDVGDIEDIVSIIHEGEDDGLDQTRVITIRRDVLDLHLAVTGTALVRMFDSTRFCIGAFNGWGEIDETVIHDDATRLHFRGHYEDRHASYLRGIQLVRGLEKPSEILRHFVSGERETRRYETFITLDWRNNRIAEVSCDTSALGNYFETSDRPYEISPVFFKPDVLLKYKADPEKYEVEERQVSCPNGWSLQTYDINELGQVHTYIKYLGQLPHAEQLHWKQFNEEPKGSISKRAYVNDIKGDFDTFYSPLSSLKARLGDFVKEKAPWWVLRSPGLMKRATYTVTGRREEWANDLLALDHLLVEGLEKSYFKARLKAADREPCGQWGSIQAITILLEASGVDDEDIRSACDPLKELRHLRNKTKGHVSGKEADAIVADLKRRHGDLKQHYRDLAERLDRALEALADFHRKGLF